ncbi:MAG: peptidoglycan DD-metalloendopeptidase family protein, partial [Gammaproteobacteria bacterium]|nr:peptidoglycan DD-metalloendopeptidase family protein [Gammaproteobacteria bacterium]
LRTPLAIPPNSKSANFPAGNDFEQHEPWANRIALTVKNGDSLASLFDKHDISGRDLHAVMQLKGDTQKLKRVKPGDEILVTLDDKNNLLALSLDVDQDSKLVVNRIDHEFVASLVERPVQKRAAYKHGVIETSLFAAAKEAGLSDNLTMNLAGIFGWDIDYVYDLRVGDEFSLLYEELYRDGEKIKDGAILAAEFINDGKRLQAVRYTDATGNSDYYTPDGKAMRKEFLRAPLNFMYVSSGFNPRRFHPILKRVKAHRGIDYRAPKGTPVYAAGDGKVIRATYDKANGHHVFIQHGQRYVTKYLHFTKRTVRRGQRVKQGQTIGYVGSTGLATAPHLHYEFLVDGVHRNPRTVKLPAAKPIEEQHLNDFLANSAPMVRQLAITSDRPAIAVASP